MFKIISFEVQHVKETQLFLHQYCINTYYTYITGTCID